MVGENDQVLASAGCGEDRSDLPSRVIPSHALSKAEGDAKNLGEIASAESTLSEANVPRNDTVCRIATPSLRSGLRLVWSLAMTA